MFFHIQLCKSQIFQKIKSKEIVMGGNLKLGIFGKLNCKSGKRMKIENRVFFENWQEARNQGFRPCGNCLNKEYKNWKNGLI